MFSENQRFVGTSLFLLDLLLLTGAALFATSPVASQAAMSGLDHLSPYLLPTFLALAWWIVTLRLRVYESPRGLLPWQEVLLLVEAAALSIGLSLLLTLCVLPSLDLSVPVLLTVALGGIVANRVVVRVSHRFLQERKAPARTTLIAGRGLSATSMPGRPSTLQRVLAHNSYGVALPGYLAFSNEPRAALPEGLPVLGGIDDAGVVLTDHHVDEVLVCPSPKTPPGEIQKLLETCEMLGVSCHIAPDFLPSKDLRPDEVRWIGDIPTYSFHAVPTDPVRLALKRAIDIVGASVGIVLLSPFLVVFALCIKLTSPGPIFFRQTRVGLRGRDFRMFKFRSMYIDAEARLASLREKNEQTGPVFKMRNDPRVTSIGRLLRRYSIDEMPQLLNVLRGEMSLVGPRPPIRAEVNQYSLWQRRRLSVKPGLTCIWQVHGRNRVTFQRWMEMDMEYIDSWSLRLDLKLIARTVGTVLRGTGM